MYNSSPRLTVVTGKTHGRRSATAGTACNSACVVRADGAEAPEIVGLIFCTRPAIAIDAAYVISTEGIIK